METGWEKSAKAWIDLQGETGDFSRAHVLDRPMLARVEACAPNHVLDVGCGEGRFCRLLAERNISAIGVDPTATMREAASAMGVEVLAGRAEALPFETARFDLVVFYLSLINIADLEGAVCEAVRVLRPGGRILLGHLTSWITSAQLRDDGWVRQPDGSVRLVMENYLESFSYRARWSGIDIVNWHRPLAAYMQAFLAQGLRLTHFDEPPSYDQTDYAYEQAPYLCIMEWQKPQGPA